jgi:hypothetical protein
LFVWFQADAAHAQRLIDTSAEAVEADPFGQTGFEQDSHRLRTDGGQGNFTPSPRSI